MSEGKGISELSADTLLADAARQLLSTRFQVVHHYLGLALHEPEKDPEYVHQLRVATRRAGAALDIFAPYLPEKKYERAHKWLRGIRHAAGEARDWDVFLATLSREERNKNRRHRPGLDFLTGHALEQRIAAQTHLEKASADHPLGLDKRTAELVAAVRLPSDDQGPATLRDLAGPQILGLAADFDQAVAADFSDYERLHQARILGKRLRYAMEIFADCFAAPFREELYPAVEELQDVLGRANDSHVAHQWLSELRDQVDRFLPNEWKRLKPGIEGLLKLHQRRVVQEREHFLKWCRHWQRLGGAAAFTASLKQAGSTAGL